MSDLETTLKLIAAQAPDLRKAGVTSLAVGDIEITLAPFEPEPAPETTTTPDKPDDPLMDPDTFGGILPQRRRPDEDADPWPSPIAGGSLPRAKPTS
jgi:hypothetical protein